MQTQQVCDQMQSDSDRTKRLRVGRVEAHAAAALARVFTTRGDERYGTGDETGQPVRVQRLGQRLAIYPWRADRAKRRNGAAALAQLRPFDQAGARVEQRLPVIPQVRRR